MKGKVLLLAVSGLMVLSLVVTACGPGTPTTTQTTSATPTAPAASATQTTPVISTTTAVPGTGTTPITADKPKYGGTLTLTTNTDPTSWDPVGVIAGYQYNLTYQKLFEGDWSKGPAGGYGTNETDWGFANNDLFDVRKGFLAEDEKWTFDPATGTGTIVFTIRQGLHWQLPNTEAGRLVNGREITTDDVLYSLKRATTIGSAGHIWRVAPDLRDANITKTGPREITIKAPSQDVLLGGIGRFASYIFIVTPEVVNKYGDILNWKNYVGSGPFMLSEYIPGSLIKMNRNPNYWEKNPIGPGKGDQLPYLDTVRIMIIPDLSTRYAAFRTGKADWIDNISFTDYPSFKKTAIGIVEKMGTSSQG